MRVYALIAFVFFCLNAGLLPAPPYASFVIEANSGQVIHKVDAEKKLYPASLTKAMTLFLVFEALRKGKLNLAQYVKVSAKAARQPALRLGLKRGQKIRVKDAVMGLICHSANDAAIVLAEAVAKTEKAFVCQMNAKARLLGMRRTKFRNPTGLFHACNVSTARDMATLGMALLRHFPREYRIFKAREFTYKGRVYPSTNKLLGKVPGVDGLKTGYIRLAGYNLISSARRGHRRLVAVVLGGKTAEWRDDHMEALLERSFRKQSHPPLRMAAMDVAVGHYLPMASKREQALFAASKAGPLRNVLWPYPSYATASSQHRNALLPYVSMVPLQSNNVWWRQKAVDRNMLIFQRRRFMRQALQTYHRVI